ncbi:hypothetical protein [Xanthocytophaga flava]|uniref:hypothetical protein n=1 Tax=Xanthocytophaga flava TaxID=3048013 RepID=UPI0028D381EE|nr:hypothetical protein [Xanthocytophaga flavus]MDJ1472791.1 hypothetical protein [Xanthocytophaga flavus]
MHLLHANHKRIYYVPGLISLLVLPFLLGKIYFHEKQRQNQRVISVLAKHPYLNREAFRFIPDFPSERNYLDISITGEQETDLIKLNYAQLRIREIVRLQNCMYGIHILFSDTASYWTLVKAISICKMEKINMYILYKKGLWIYYMPPNTVVINPMYTTPICDNTSTIETIWDDTSLPLPWYKISVIQYLIAGFVAFLSIVILNRK